MRLDESIIEQFDLNTDADREPVNVIKVSELLDFLKQSAFRIQSKSEL